jgi:hypothetical protein
MRRSWLMGLVGVVGTLWGAGAYSQLLPSPIPAETAEPKLANVSFEVESVMEDLLSRQEAGPADDFEMGQTRGMLRRLLADRFGLLVHQEMRVMPTYSLEWGDRKLWTNRSTIE